MKPKPTFHLKLHSLRMTNETFLPIFLHFILMMVGLGSLTVFSSEPDGDGDANSKCIKRDSSNV
jgi:hypothetical protein